LITCKVCKIPNLNHLKEYLIYNLIYNVREITKRKSTPRTQPKPPSKKLKADIAKLQEWKSTDPTREVLNQLIQSNFKDRTIAQSRTAMKAQDLLKSNDLNKFGKFYSRITSLATVKQGKKQVKREERNRVEKEETDRVIKTVEREVFRPRLITRKQETEAPSYEVEFKKDYFNASEAWEAGNKALIRMIEKHMEKKPNIKIYLGYKYQVTKITIDANGPDPDEVEQVRGASQEGNLHDQTS
jgi:hypothetical protein